MFFAWIIYSLIEGCLALNNLFYGRKILQMWVKIKKKGQGKYTDTDGNYPQQSLDLNHEPQPVQLLRQTRSTPMQSGSQVPRKQQGPSQHDSCNL